MRKEEEDSAEGSGMDGEIVATRRNGGDCCPVPSPRRVFCLFGSWTLSAGRWTFEANGADWHRTSNVQRRSAEPALTAARSRAVADAARCSRAVADSARFSRRTGRGRKVLY